VLDAIAKENLQSSLGFLHGRRL